MLGVVATSERMRGSRAASCRASSAPRDPPTKPIRDASIDGTVAT